MTSWPSTASTWTTTPWLAAAWPLLVALLVGLLVWRALIGIARRASAHADQSLRARIALVVATPAAVALPLFFLSLAVAGAPLPAAWIGVIQHWLGIGGLLCVTWLAVRAAGAIEGRIVRDHPLDVSDNLRARRVQTQVRVLGRVLQVAIAFIGISIALMTFPAIRQIGTTLLASAGVVGLVAGIAARPVFGNLIAGLQLALTQPIRLDDVVIVNDEWGRIEEITSTYVVVRVWDERRMVVPLQWFIEHPFQNWTRTSSELLGTVTIWTDYRLPVDPLRAEATRICQGADEWDGRLCIIQVTDASERAMQLRVLVSAQDAGRCFDLRCKVREGLIAYIHLHYPECLPRVRVDEDARQLAAEQ